jgi:uncharacterized protein
MDWLWYFILLLVMASGLFVNILGLPGLWLLVAAVAGYAWVTGGVYVGWTGLLTLVGLGIVGEIVEFIAGGAGAKVAGGTKRAMAGSIVGALVGGILFSPVFPVIGTIFGACLGAFVGAAVIELAIRRDFGQAARVGTGAARGRFWGIIYKSLIGCIMFIVGMIVAFPIGRPPPAMTAPPPPPPAELPATPPDPLPKESPSPPFPLPATDPA